MERTETDIRRHANGSIDTAYYVAQCRRQRSLAAHKAIARLVNAASALARRLRVRGHDTAGQRTADRVDGQAPAPTREDRMRTAA